MNSPEVKVSDSAAKRIATLTAAEGPAMGVSNQVMTLVLKVSWAVLPPLPAWGV